MEKFYFIMNVIYEYKILTYPIVFWIFVFWFVVADVAFNYRIINGDFKPKDNRSYIPSFLFAIIMAGLFILFCQNDREARLSREYCLSEQYKNTDICLAAKIYFIKGKGYRFENNPDARQVSQMASIMQDKKNALAEQKQLEKDMQRIEKEEFLKNMHKIEIKG